MERHRRRRRVAGPPHGTCSSRPRDHGALPRVLSISGTAARGAGHLAYAARHQSGDIAGSGRARGGGRAQVLSGVGALTLPGPDGMMPPSEGPPMERRWDRLSRRDLLPSRGARAGRSRPWTFVRIDGVQSINNVSERALRPAVLWRKGSVGSDTEAGSRFAARLLTALVTCRQPGWRPVDFL